MNKTKKMLMVFTVISFIVPVCSGMKRFVLSIPIVGEGQPFDKKKTSGVEIFQHTIREGAKIYPTGIVCKPKKILDAINELFDCKFSTYEVEQIVRNSGLNFNECVDDRGRTAYHVAVLLRDYNCLNVLIYSGMPLNKVDDIGMTPLHLAARVGVVQAILILLGMHDNRLQLLNKVDTCGRTALNIAAIWGHSRCLETLLDFGADVEITDNAGHSVLWNIFDVFHFIDSDDFIRPGIIECAETLVIYCLNHKIDVPEYFMDILELEMGIFITCI